MDLIFVRRGLGVTDPRDVIFAHLGFASNTIRPKVDSTNTLEQVYTDLAVSYTQVTKDCRIMFHVNEHHGCITNPSEIISLGMNPSPRPLPSWVPDWRMPTPTNIKPYTVPIQHLLVASSKRLKCNTSVQVCTGGMPTVLILGCCSEQVLKLSDPLSYKKVSSKDSELAAQASKYLINDKALDSLKGEKSTRAYNKIFNMWREAVEDEEILPIIIERREPIFEDRPRYPYGKLGAKMPSWRGPSQYVYEPGTTMPVRDSIADCLVSAFNPHFNLDFLESRRLARFSSGVLALVPSTARAGDMAIHSMNARHWHRQPFLLRPFQEVQEPAADEKIRRVFEEHKNTDDEKQNKVWGLEFDASKFPISHRTHVGPTFLYGTEFMDWISDEGIISEVEEGEWVNAKTFPVPMTIYNVH